MENFELIREIYRDLGLVFGFIMFIAIVSIGIIMFYFRSKIVSDLDEKTKINIEKLEKKLNLTFRDEKIRRELTIYSAKKSIEKKIELFMNVSSDYNEVMDAFKFVPIVPKEKIDPLMVKVHKRKNEIIDNSIFLGGELTEILLKINRKILEAIYGRRVADKMNNPLHNPEIKKKENQIRLNIMKYNSEVKDAFSLARELIVKNLYTDQDIERYNISQNQNDVIEQARNTFIQEEFEKE